MKVQKFVFRSIITAFMLVVMVSSPAISKEDGTKKSSSKDLVTTAVEAGSFTVLAKALIETDLVNTLKGEGPFTVFAPTDEAFAKLPEGTIEGLLKDKETLKQILLYHVVSGKVASGDVVKMDKATTVSGKEISIKVKDGNVMINNSNVVGVNVMASNGVIHVIDTVLIP